ncbi:MAG: HAD family phosphatase [Lachnospiraceae bacterium]|nr:HAD family phosphatase [Lachnospiraceae bacterium]
MIKNIIFDIGNVLSKFNYEEHFRKFASQEDIYQRLINATIFNPIWNELDRGVLAEEEILAEFIQKDPGISDEIQDMFQHMTGIVKEYDYATEWIEELKSRGYRVLVLSNFSKLVYEMNREELKFLKVVDGGILSYKEKLIKPDAAIYQLLMQQYQLVPEECVFLDDREENITAAKALGWSGILFTTKEKAVEELDRIL